MRTLEERVEALEHSVRRYRGMALILALILVAGTLLAASPRTKEIVRCKKLEVMDDQGKARAVLGVIGEGPILKFFDAIGKTSGQLGVLEDGRVGLALYDTQEIKRVSISVLKERKQGLATFNDEPSIALYNSFGKNRAWLAVLDNKPILYLYNTKGKLVFSKP